MYTYDENIVSDLHKDAFGFRPTQSFWAHWNEASDAERQRVWDGLLVSLTAAIEEDKRREQRAVARFEDRIASIIGCGADNRKVAIRWIHQAEDTDGTDEHLEWCMGLPFGYLKKN